MTLTQWVEELPEDYFEMELEVCALCGEDEEYDFNLCIACVEELNENEHEMLLTNTH
jgi:hypothetical protein